MRKFDPLSPFIDVPRTMTGRVMLFLVALFVGEFVGVWISRSIHGLTDRIDHYALLLAAFNLWSFSLLVLLIASLAVYLRYEVRHWLLGLMFVLASAHGYLLQVAASRAG